MKICFKKQVQKQIVVIRPAHRKNKIRWHFPAICVLVIFAPVSVRGGYLLKPEKEICLFTAGAGLTVLGYSLPGRMDQAVDFSGSARDLIYPERFSVRCRRADLDRASDITVALCSLMPVLLPLSGETAGCGGRHAVMYCESILILNGLVNVSKNAVQRARPYVYHRAVPGQVFDEKKDYQSFFSAHTAFAFLGAVYTGTVLEQTRPGALWNRYVWIGGLSLAAVTGMFRILSGNHFPTDVLTGAVIGSVIGYLIPAVHWNHSEERHGRTGSFAPRLHIQISF